MKALVISDSHGNISNIKHVLEFGKKIEVDAIIHCGDWNNLESVNTVINFNIPLYGVIGNADIADNIKRKFSKDLEIKLDNKKIFVTHKFSNQDLRFKNYDIVFCGHYHRQQQVGNVVNPGALENSINFAIYDTTTGKVEFLHD